MTIFMGKIEAAWKAYIPKNSSLVRQKQEVPE